MWSFLAALLKPLIDWFQRRSQDARHEGRLRELLTSMPEGVQWRSIKLLSESIGVDEKETARLLVKIGARRSTGDKNVWALTSKKPL